MAALLRRTPRRRRILPLRLLTRSERARRGEGVLEGLDRPGVVRRDVVGTVGIVSHGGWADRIEIMMVKVETHLRTLLNILQYRGEG
jgi:hypothetical protein